MRTTTVPATVLSVIVAGHATSATPALPAEVAGRIQTTIEAGNPQHDP